MLMMKIITTVVINRVYRLYLVILGIVGAVIHSWHRRHQIAGRDQVLVLVLGLVLVVVAQVRRGRGRRPQCLHPVTVHGAFLADRTGGLLLPGLRRRLEQDVDILGWRTCRGNLVRQGDPVHLKISKLKLTK